MSDSDRPIPFTLYGIPASPGVALGKIRLISHRDLEIPSGKVSGRQIQREHEKSEEVLRKVEGELRELKSSQDDSEVRQILDAQIEIIRDPELKSRVGQLISEDQRSSEYALYTAFNEYIQLMNSSGQGWIRDRIIDLQSLRNRLVHRTGNSGSAERPSTGSIVFAEELSPTEVIEFSESGIAAIVMQHGGPTSHAAIIAQSLDIPCVVGLPWKRSDLVRFDSAAVDAVSGEVVIGPDKQAEERFRLKRRQVEAARREAVEISRGPSRTACGEPFRLQANIEFEEELRRAGEYRAEGVGLLRTETLFLRQGYYDAERHLLFYRRILDGTGEYPVTIRLLDIGGDKLPGRKVDEANPFLGWRGLRMLLDEKQLLEMQLKTILRVAAEAPGRVRILVPMVSDIGEFREIRKRVDQVRNSLAEQGEALTAEVPVGVMIEVPAIALMATEIASEADFFSIGSNDLTQYVLAADRGNERVSQLYTPAHPAVWKLIRHSWQAAVEAGIPISVCGEIAGNPVLAGALIGMGMRELSMNPASIPMVKKVISTYDLATFRDLYDSLVQSSGREESLQRMTAWQERYMESP